MDTADKMSEIDNVQDEDMIISPRNLLPRLSFVDISDRLAVMRIQEDSIYRCSDYVSWTKHCFEDKDDDCHHGEDDGNGSNRNNHNTNHARQQHHKNRQFIPVDEECRMKMCEWCYQVIDFCKLRRETVDISMSYLDRYASLARNVLMDRRKYQLAAMTSLYVAIKIFEPPLPISSVSDLSRGVYSEDEISEMEVELLFTLNWRVSAPTILGFIYHMVSFIVEEASDENVSKLLDFSQFQAELAVGDYSFATQRSSSIALAALMNSMGILDPHSFPFSLRYRLLKAIEVACNVFPFDSEINALRERLSDAFGKSAGHPLPQIYEFSLHDFALYDSGNAAQDGIMNGKKSAGCKAPHVMGEETIMMETESR
mmetsp:Transcript_6063/g.12046  ORF Transcript_6063/g.12046 Transcript_6063/m.12046 type:complete len:370 (-) Transcript_6063:148-1257(-)